MLITIKAGMQGLTEFKPFHGLQLFNHRLNPTLCRAKELHVGALDQNRRINRVHLKVILSACNPEFKIGAIKGWEGHFWELASGVMVVLGWAVVG